MTLYELTGAYLEYYKREDPESKIIAEDIKGNLKKKLEGWGKAYQNLASDYQVQKEEMDALKEKAQHTKQKMDVIRDTILNVMLVTENANIHTPLFDFSVRTGADTLVIDDEDAVPEEFFKPQKPKLDKTSLNKWAKNNGEKVKAFGHYEPQNSLIIK